MHAFTCFCVGEAGEATASAATGYIERYDWGTWYNEVHPGSALQWTTLAEFASQAREATSPVNSTKPEICHF